MTADRNEMSRRQFTATTSLAAAAVVAGRREARARRERPRRARHHRHPRPGQRAQARLREAAERRDQDAVRHRREPLRAPSASTTRELKDVADLQARLSCRTCGACSTTRTSTASSSRRRTTGTRSPRSGRCRPASTSTSRSRRRTRCGKAARWSRRTQRYGKIVQVGTMNRSRPAVRQAIKFIHDGGIGKVYMARGLCFKPRPAIGKYPDGPMHRRQAAPPERRGGRCPSGLWDAAYLAKVDYDLWLGPGAEARRSTATASTTTGTGTGTTATATPATRARTSSTSRAGASARTSTR